MKKYIIRFKVFLLFIGVFFGCYAFLGGMYHLFLGKFDGNEVDTMTRLVCHNTQRLLSVFYDELTVVEAKFEPSFWLFLYGRPTLRIVEGCNGMSIIILFVSFVAAFSGRLKNTLLFILGGSLLIYVLNVLRIALLIALLYYYPSYTHMLHGVLFPLLIYGVVFVLWLVWIHKYSSYAT